MDVSAWLTGLGLAEHVKAFADNGVDAAMLPKLTNDDLKDLGVTRLADRKRLLEAIAGLSAGQDQHPPASAAPDGERRQVTVLFADIAGFTRLTSALGAEEIHGLLNRYFETVDAVIESYGGVVDKHIGDSVMAVFGAPVAHDDDPLRAVRAALAIHERMAALTRDGNRLLQAHIGIANGQVVASNTGSDAHREYTVTGDSVNLAARLQDKAQAGETLISDALRRAIGGRVECSSLGAIDVKGIDAPVRIWRVAGVREAEAPSTRVAFVGRRAEVAQFSGIVDLCRASGRGQAIAVRGDAGIGKSRLVAEFARTAAEEGFVTHRALVLDFGAGEGRDAIRSLVGSLLGLTPGGGNLAGQEAAAKAVRDALLLPEQRIFLDDLLNLPQKVEDRAVYDAMTNAARNEGKRKLAGDLLRHVSASRPVVAVIEDIHWANPSILLHLAALAAAAAECPALLIMTSRVDGYPLDQNWRGAAGGCSLMTLDLGPLRREDAETLASTFLETTSQLAQSCVERAAGNPLFLEQLLRNLDERGGEDVPASIQSLVLARIDRLPPADKQALQAASVLGKRFSLEALRQLIKSTQYTCAGLLQRSLIRQEGDDYLFAHALVQEGVYNSLLKARRGGLHRDAAAWYRNLGDLVLCAEHLDRAGDPGAAAAYLDAAKAQSAGFHFDTALRLADRGIELAGDPSTKCDLICLRGDALRNMGATAQSVTAFELALEAANDDTRRCQAWIGMAAGMRIADRQQDALQALAQAEATAVRHGLVSDLVHIHYLRGNIYFPLGNIEGCLAEHQKALSFAREVGSTEGEALALGGLGDAYYLRGHMRTACEQFRACIRLCQDHGYGRIEVANRHMVGWTRIHLMEFAEALDDAVESIRMADVVSHRRAKLLGLMLAGDVEFELGNLTESQNYLELALELARAMGAGNFEAQSLVHLAEVHAAKGSRAEARDLAERAVSLVRKVGMTFIGPMALALKAMLAEDRDEYAKGLAEAESFLDSVSVAHNHVFFAKTAIDHALAIEDWDAADRYAARLDEYTLEEPLPWSSFLIARGRALAAWGRGTRSGDVVAELSRLHELALRHGLKPLAADLGRVLAVA